MGRKMTNIDDSDTENTCHIQMALDTENGRFTIGNHTGENSGVGLLK